MVNNADRKMDLPPQAIDLEKLLALVAVHLDVLYQNFNLYPSPLANITPRSGLLQNNSVGFCGLPRLMQQAYCFTNAA